MADRKMEKNGKISEIEVEFRNKRFIEALDNEINKEIVQEILYGKSTGKTEKE